MVLSLFRRIPLSVRFILFSALGFSLMSAFVKLVYSYGIPVFEIIAGRAIVSLVISYVDVKRKGIPVWGKRKGLLFARGFIGTLALLCVYYAVSTLPLALATILQYINPVFIAVIAFIFLRERLSRATILCIILSLTGLIVIVSPNLSFSAATDVPLISIGIALLGALGSSIAYTIVKRLSNVEDSSVIIFYFPLIALPVSAVLMLHSFVLPDLKTLFFMILVGIFTQMGQVGITKAMQTESASKASAYSYIQVIFAMLLGWAMFNNIPTLWTLAGGVLIIGGAIINLLGSHRDSRLLSLKTPQNSLHEAKRS